MHIGFDAKRAFTNNTGLGNYSRFTMNALCSLHDENTYSLYTPSIANSEIFEAPKNSELRLPDTIWTKNLKAYWRSIGINKQLMRDQIDLFHGLSNEIPFGIDKTGIKSVVSIHDLIFLRFPDLYRNIDRRIYRKKAQYASAAADRIIAISKQTKQDLIELLGTDEKKIHIVYQGCNPWFYNRQDTEQLHSIRKKYSLPANYLLYVGTIEKRKNLLDIIKAIHQSAIDIPLIVVGKKTEYYMLVLKYIQDQKVKNIHFLDDVPNTDLPAVYQLADIFIYPSSYEGFGIPVLEALNSGIPVISSRGGCLEETAGDGGLLITPGNVEELSDAITSILRDSELKDKLIHAGAKHALSFREEHTIPQLINIYKDCMQ